MHKTAAESKSFIEALKAETSSKAFLAVPFTALEAAAQLAEGTNIVIGAQNMHDHEEGAFTGEISASMLKASGAAFVLLGHSERRHYFAEDNRFIHRKVMRALKEDLTPILCVGELASHRENGEQETILECQLEESLQDVSCELALKIAIAYEPVWAIGTGKAATSEMAQEIHLFIREWLIKRFGKEVAGKIPLLYGGSVNAKNVAGFLCKPDINGVLVGGASLDPKMFAQILRENL